MHNKNYDHFCRVCGLDQEEAIWGEDGKTPSFEICSCCGVQFGYGDDNPEQCRRVRKHWIEKEGAKWSWPKGKPENWSLEEQLKQIPPAFRDNPPDSEEES